MRDPCALRRACLGANGLNGLNGCERKGCEQMTGANVRDHGKRSWKSVMAIGLLALAGCQDAPTRGAAGIIPGLGGGEEEECITPDGESCAVPQCDDPCAYNDATFGDECIVVGAGVCDDARGVEVSFQQQGATVPAPGGFFKPGDKMLEKWVTARWQEQADMVVPKNVEAMLTKGGVKMWNYPDGNGWTRTDFHAGIMSLPTGDTPQALLSAMANDIIKATGNGDFSGWVGWPAAAGNRKVGDMVDLDIWGPDNGPVGYWKIDPDRFCVITLQNKTAGIHPVNGIRCWGFVPMAINPNWMATNSGKKKWGCAGPTYMFYTIGIDSPSIAGGGLGSGMQASTWNALIRDLLRENDRNGGVSGRWYQQKTIAQSNSLAPKSGVKVTPPGDRDSHYCKLPSDGYKDGELCMDPGQGAAAGGCEEGEYTCSNGQCIPGQQRCDGTAQCEDRDDEDACDVPDVDGCPANQFACSDGTCIPGDWKCDGQYEDCSEGEDEASCSEADMGCKGDEFTCGDGQCIPGAWKCDAITDCDDGTDENACDGDGGGGQSCSASEFACGDGQCITGSWQCDDIVDCADGSDEMGCGDGGGGGGETCDGFACGDGQCIAASWECDGITDCSDGSDEADCDDGGGGGGGGGGGASCSADQFTCGDGQCINGSWECDVIVDCADGSDEANCDDGSGGGTSCGADEYACNDGECIPASWECDVYVDCAGGEDEASC